MIIALGTDHAGIELKEIVKKFLEENGYKVKDFGAYEYDSADDYPDFINPTAEFVSKNNNGISIPRLYTSIFWIISFSLISLDCIFLTSNS